MNGSVMAMQCPDCDAVFYLLGDFINGEGQLVRAGEIHSDDCAKCKAICDEVGM
jgi:predicted Zn finger-like uncharacterized protein